MTNMGTNMTKKSLVFETASSAAYKKPFAPRCALCVSLQILARNIMTLKQFSSTVAGAIVINSIVIGIQTDWAIQNVSEPVPVEFSVLDTIFTIFFTVELTLRLSAEQAYFLARANQNLSWNVLDSFIVLSALAEEVISSADTNFEAARLLRILRLVRVVRVIRVMRFFS